MKLAIVGVGQAGGRILDRLLGYEATHKAEFIRHAVAIDTTRAALQNHTHVREANRLLIGEGTGTGTDREAGAASVREHIDEIQNAIDRTDTREIDAFLLIAALGGGAGSGGAPVIAERLQSIHSHPVYSLGILPTTGEGGIYNHNAASALQPLVEHTDTVLLFDNDAFKSSAESVTEDYAKMNAELTTRIGMLFAADESNAMGGNVAESSIDSAEIIHTLDGHGFTSIGYAAEEIETNNGGLLSRFLGSNEPDFVSAGDAANRITSLVRQATLRRLTLPCEIESTSQALLFVSGPPEQLDRTGIHEARSWLEETTNCRNVRVGGYPLPNEDKVAVLVILSGITDIPRIKEIQKLATEPE